jgi:hypothetical protein
MKRGMVLGVIVLASAGGWLTARASVAPPAKDQRVFELRIYTVLPDRMPVMHARFKNHTNALLTKHGMTLIGFWTPQGADAEKKLYYLVAHKSKEAADASWGAFIQNPEWKKVREESEKDGKIVEKVERVWLDPAEYSMMK